MTNDTVIDEDMNKAGKYLNDLFSGSGCKDTIDRLKAMFNTEKNLHPLVALFSLHRRQHASIPAEPSVQMCSGLAKEIMAWSHFTGPRTIKQLFSHLEIMSYRIPDWLREDPAVLDQSRTPTDQDRCRLVYKAMVNSHLELVEKTNAAAA